MRTCQSCGKENPDDRDFCDCGEYLRWDPTGVVQAITPEMAAQAVEAKPVAQAPAAPQPAQPAAPPAPAPAPDHDNGAGNGSGNGVTSGDPLGGGAAPAAPAPPPPSAPAPAPAVARTAVHGAVPVPPPPAAPAPEPEPDPAAITLRLPDSDSAKGEMLALGINPGERERVLALVRNQSGIVDNYELSVRGLPHEWYSIFPDTVYLVPFGTGGTYEQEVEVHLHPPKTAEAEARIWELAVAAQSKAYNREAAASVPLMLGIQPFQDYETKVKPERVSGRRKASYEVTVKNKANAPLVAAMDAADQDSSLVYAYEPADLEVKPGETLTSTLLVRPPKQIWLGRPQERRFDVLTRTGEEAAAMAAAKSAEEVPEGMEDEFQREYREGEELAEGEYVQGSPKRGRFGRRKNVPGMHGPQVYKPQVYKPNAYIGPQGIQLQKPMVTGPRMSGPQMSGMQLNLSSLKPGGGGAAVITGPLLPSQAVFRQKPWLPWWLAVVIPLLILAAILLYLLLPKTTVVPDVTGNDSTFAAEKELTEAKLKLNPTTKDKVDAKAKPGTVIGQTPKAGEKVEKESEVAVLVAVGTGTVKVPKIVGLNSGGAEKALREAKLTLGAATPQPADPKAKIKSQIPAANEIVKEGAPIAIFLPKPGEKGAGGDEAKKKDGGGGGGAAGGGGGGGEGGDVTVAAIEKLDVAAYAQAAADDGLVPEQVKAFSETKPGTLFATEPPGGTKVKAGTTVKLLVSGGSPLMAFDNGKDVLLVNSGTRKREKAIAKGPQVERDPAFSFDGTKVTFVGGKRVFLTDREKPDEPPVALTQESEEFSDLAFAPTVDLNLLAMLRKKGEDSDLCFGQITKDGMRPECIADPKLNLIKTVRWAPDGKSVFALGVKGLGTFGIVRYTSKKAFSPEAKDWGKGKFVTDTTQTNKGAIDFAISPDGKQMAMVANFEGDVFQLFLGKPKDFLLTDAKPQGVRACKVAWRSDNRELVVVQADEACAEPNGQLVRLPVDKPTEQLQLGLSGDNPVFQPLTLG